MCTVCVLYVYCMCTVCIIISVFFSFGVDPVVSLKSLRWHVARLPGALVDTLHS